MTTRLELQFETSEGKNRTLAIHAPVLNLEAETVQSAMERIAAQELFVDGDDRLYATVKAARYVTRTVDPVLEVE